MTSRALAGSLLALVLCAGCNAIFDIHKGKPYSTGCGDALIIDDLEDGNGAICDTESSAKRKGAWFIVSDGTETTLEPAPGAPFMPTAIPDGRGDSRYAARMTGSGFSGWGARMGFNLNVDGLGARPYNASTIGGINFWMKSNVPIAVELPISATIPETEGGGTCADVAGEPNCGRHFGFPINKPDPDRWLEYSIPFAALSQPITIDDANGNNVFGSASWNQTELVSIQFAPLQTSFDVWVDDIRFYGCTPADCRPTCTEPVLPVSCPARGDVPAGCWPAGTDCAAVPVLDNIFLGAWGTGPGALWVVGGSQHGAGGTIIRWNGAAWSAALASTNAFLSAVWGTGPDDIWAAGDGGTIIHWDGAVWSPVISKTETSLSAVWGTAPDDVWAVGHGGTILHWDGVAWTSVSSGTSYWLNSVWGTGPSDVWAVGNSEDMSQGLIVHWNGVSWTVVNGGGRDVRFGVWAATPADAWSVGVGAGGASISHWNGTRWSPVALGPVPGAFLVSVWGSGPTDVWAVGDRGTIVHWNGTAWSVVPSGTTQFLLRVWGSGPTDVWAVGDRGTIVRWNGAAWSVVPPGAITVSGR